jgi:hypothetical protein
MAPPSRVTLHLGDSIIDCPSRGTSMNLPIAVLQRLDALATAARRQRVSRNELLAALIADADIDAAELERLVMRYRGKYISEVLPDTEDVKQDSVVVPLPKRGRPAAASG